MKVYLSDNYDTREINVDVSYLYISQLGNKIHIGISSTIEAEITIKEFEAFNRQYIARIIYKEKK